VSGCVRLRSCRIGPGLYAILCVLTTVSFAAGPGFHGVRHGVLPVLGLALNLELATAALWIGIDAGGDLIARGCVIALGMAGSWLVQNVGYYLLRR
jgi:hypothetical protein